MSGNRTSFFFKNDSYAEIQNFKTIAFQIFVSTNYSQNIGFFRE